jgi:hypothetical protein
MATVPIRLFFRGNRQYGIGSIKFDLILTESHSRTNQVTEHPVEDGSSISDHIKNDLENGALGGIISNFSINVVGLTTNRAQDAFDALESLWKERTLTTMVTVLKVYEDVAIVDLSMDRSETSGESLVIQCSFRKVKKVQLKTVQVDATVSIKDMNTSLNRQSAVTVDAGRTVGEVQ